MIKTEFTLAQPAGSPMTRIEIRAERNQQEAAA
jgi:hypothetical protein